MAPNILSDRDRTLKLPERRFYSPIIQTLRHPDKPVLCSKSLAFSLWYLNHCDQFYGVPRNEGGLNDVLDAMMVFVTTAPTNNPFPASNMCQCNRKEPEIEYWHGLCNILSSSSDAIYHGRGTLEEVLHDICFTVSMMLLVYTRGPENGRFGYVTEGFWPELTSSLVPTTPSKMVASMAAWYIKTGVSDILAVLGQICCLGSCQELSEPVVSNGPLIRAFAQQYTKLAKSMSDKNPSDNEGRRPAMNCALFLKGVLVWPSKTEEHLIRHSLELYSAHVTIRNITWTWGGEYKDTHKIQNTLHNVLWMFIPEKSRPPMPKTIDSRPASQRPYMDDEQKRNSDPYALLFIHFNLNSKMPHFRRICMSPYCRNPERKSTNACTGCNYFRYCSKDCQIAAWKYKEGVSHKQICKNWGNFKKLYDQLGQGDLEEFRRLLEKEGWTRAKLWGFWDLAGPHMEHAEQAKEPDIPA